MIGRVTDGMMSARVLEDLRRSRHLISEAQGQVASGKRLTHPSIDPLAASRAIRLRAEVAQIGEHRENAAEVSGWLTVTDQALGSVTDAVQRVRELALQGANDSYNSANRNAIADEVDQLIGEIKLAANAKYGSSFVFAGQQTPTAPYQQGPDTYAGDGGPVVRTIGPGVSLQINVPGGALFGNGADGRLLNVLRDVSAHLRSGVPADVNALRTTDLRNLDARMGDLLQARTVNGALKNRVDAAMARLDEVKLTTTDFLSQTEDTDIAQAILALNTQQAAYQAALKTGAQLIQPSLLDFLR